MSTAHLVKSGQLDSFTTTTCPPEVDVDELSEHTSRHDVAARLILDSELLAVRSVGRDLRLRLIEETTAAVGQIRPLASAREAGPSAELRRINIAAKSRDYLPRGRWGFSIVKA